EAQPREVRAQRMQLFTRFMAEIERERPGAGDHVSEVDLSDAQDIRALLTGLGNVEVKQDPVSVHFGNSHFAGRYRLLLQYLDQWRQSSGGLDSVDLRFSGQVVINPERNSVAKVEN